jgi:hypothetical protein
MKQFFIRLWNGIKETQSKAAEARLKTLGH